jgi:hypothetical protein
LRRVFILTYRNFGNYSPLNLWHLWPEPESQEFKLPFQISYFLENCKKGKSPKKGFALIEKIIFQIF